MAFVKKIVTKVAEATRIKSPYMKMLELVKTDLAGAMDYAVLALQKEFERVQRILEAERKLFDVKQAEIVAEKILCRMFENAHPDDLLLPRAYLMGLLSIEPQYQKVVYGLGYLATICLLLRRQIVKERTMKIEVEVIKVESQTDDGSMLVDLEMTEKPRVRDAYAEEQAWRSTVDLKAQFDRMVRVLAHKYHTCWFPEVEEWVAVCRETVDKDEMLRPDTTFATSQEVLALLK